MNTWTVPGYAESLELGSGASGRVVLAVHEETGVAVAVKYLSESLRTRPGFVHDFRAEARLLGGLGSPYVAGLYEYVEAPRGAAIVMELVDGVSLRTLLTRQGPLALESALVVLKGSLLGLADAHRVGVVHRDYKPGNVLVMPQGASKLVDFGIAAGAGTSVGVAGTPSYMAPEQWTGAPASPAADVYAATATFFECLTGRTPYLGENFAELALQHLDAPVPAHEVPEAVRSLVLRGLAKTPEARPTHAEAFVTELEEAAHAACGPDWEERGRRGLAALVALLPLLLPSARSARHTTTDTARTVLSRKPRPDRAEWRPGLPGILVSAGALLVALVLGHGLAPRADSAQQTARALATTAARPGAAAGATAPAAPSRPSPSQASTPSPGVPSSDPADTASGGPAPSATVTATAPSPDPPTSGAPAGGAPTVSTTPTTTPTGTPAAPAVKDVTVTGLQQTGSSTGSATITVSTDGTGPISLTVAWYTGDTNGQLGTPDGTSQTFERSGATQYTLTVDHTFQGTGCYWGVRAATTPASAGGGASQQLLTRRCEIQ